MATIDEIKEDIGWLKIIFGILTAIDISLLGWIAQNYNKATLFVFTILQFLSLLFVR